MQYLLRPTGLPLQGLPARVVAAQAVHGFLRFSFFFAMFGLYQKDELFTPALATSVH